MSKNVIFEKISFAKLLIIMITIIGFGGLLLMNQNNESNVTKTALSIQTIKNDIKNGGHLIDVRTPEEYKGSHINGAININSVDILAGNLPTFSKDKIIYLYCRSGNRSGQVATYLKKAGFKNIVDLGPMTKVQSIGGVISRE